MALLTDLHIHTALSPCAEEEMTPGNIIAMAMLKKLDVIAITDHQSCANCEAAIKIASKMEAQYGDSVPVVIPGIEITTAEEIHLLCLFPDLVSAQRMSEKIDRAMLPLKNRPEIFGRQLIFNEKDEVAAEDERLLMMAAQMSAQEIAASVIDLGGACLPAHLDRSSNSMLSVFGMVPDDFPLKYVEISWQTELETFYQKNEILRKYPIIRNSDAHRLVDIAEPGWELDIRIPSDRKEWPLKLISALR